jgi:hypothetical protein
VTHDPLAWLLADELATFAEGMWWARVAGAVEPAESEPAKTPPRQGRAWADSLAEQDGFARPVT